MGDHRVIAGVSRTLRTLLKDRMQDTTPAVTLLPPDVDPDDGTDKRVNLFLFQVEENAHLKNQQFPGPGSHAGAKPPPLSLNLHYLLTTFKGQDTEGAQELLGDAMRVLHDYSIVTKKLPQQRAPSTNGDRPPVLDQRLQEEYEQVKLSLEPLTVNEMSEIWTAFTVPYRLSVAYSVSVVQIESLRSEGIVRLVGEPPRAGPEVFPVPYQSPKILELRVVRHDDPSGSEFRFPHIRIGDTLTIIGRNFVDGETQVMLGGLNVTTTAAIEQNRIEVNVPDDADLQPGPLSVQLQQQMIERPAPQESLSHTSNRSYIALVPEVKKLTPGTLSPPATLTIEGTRLYRGDAENVTFIGDAVIAASDYTTKTSSKIAMNVPDLDPGKYPVRVRVGRMESVGDELQLLDIQ
ncbi:MAG: DUF4255 domain-containing protein [Spirochaetes bacterium]|jgi:hypothetical protein|nr:DUF4255 domain-containing protein [Spirochaetota bacterium]